MNDFYKEIFSHDVCLMNSSDLLPPMGLGKFKSILGNLCRFCFCYDFNIFYTTRHNLKIAFISQRYKVGKKIYTMITLSVKSESINLKVLSQDKVIQCHLHSTSLVSESDPIMKANAMRRSWGGGVRVGVGCTPPQRKIQISSIYKVILPRYLSDPLLPEPTTPQDLHTLYMQICLCIQQMCTYSINNNQFIYLYKIKT